MLAINLFKTKKLDSIALFPISCNIVLYVLLKSSMLKVPTGNRRISSIFDFFQKNRFFPNSATI
jgi:hypothetical protein